MTQVPLSYRDAGVDINAGDALVERIKPLARRTVREGVLAAPARKKPRGACPEVSRLFNLPPTCGRSRRSAPAG